MPSNLQFSCGCFRYLGDINHQYLRSACLDRSTNGRNSLPILFLLIAMQQFSLAILRKNEKLQPYVKYLSADAAENNRAHQAIRILLSYNWKISKKSSYPYSNRNDTYQGMHRHQ